MRNKRWRLAALLRGADIEQGSGDGVYDDGWVMMAGASTDQHHGNARFIETDTNSGVSSSRIAHV